MYKILKKEKEKNEEKENKDEPALGLLYSWLSASGQMYVHLHLHPLVAHTLTVQYSRMFPPCQSYFHNLQKLLSLFSTGAQLLIQELAVWSAWEKAK